MTNDGRPYAPIRFKQILYESYIISKNTHNSNEDVKKMTPTEREAYINFLIEEAKRVEEEAKRVKKERKSIK